MKKTATLLSLLAVGSMFMAHAAAPVPEIIKEEVTDGKVEISWKYNAEFPNQTQYQVIVYKTHTAATDEEFVLAETGFDNIVSTGTQTKHEYNGNIWDFVPDCPGWYVKCPNYMNGAMGIDAFQYFPGSDNSDIFGGAYLLSPDYDLTNVTAPKLKVSASLGNEATSVTGGFAIYLWNTEWWDEKNIDYKASDVHDHHYTNLISTKFKLYEEVCDLDTFSNPWDKSRTRVCFYGRGYSTYWVDSLRVSIDMKANDYIHYGAELHNVGNATSFTIDTTGDTATDKVVGYEIRAMHIDQRYVYTPEGQEVETDYIRSISPSKPMKKIGDNSGIGSIDTDEFDAPEEYYSLQGIRLSEPAKGQIVIVRKGSKTYKTIIR